jgi:hypothetical protein
MDSVNDAAFSPSRRRRPTWRFGETLSATHGDFVSHPSRPVASHSFFLGDQQSVVATATSAVYRHDSAAASRELTGRIIAAARDTVRSGGGYAAQRAGTVAVQARMAGEQSRAIDAIARGVREPRHDSTVPMERAVAEIWPDAPLAIQQGINVDDAGSYTAMIRQLGPRATGHFVKTPPFVRTSGTRAGGLWMSPEDLERLQERRGFPLQAAPLHSAPSSHVANNPIPTNLASDSHTHAAIPMICVRCGFICNIVPGEEAAHQHLHQHH